MFTHSHEKKLALSVIFLSIVMMLLGYLFYDSINSIYDPRNHMFIHSVLEIFSITACACICMYGWKAYHDTTNQAFLWLPYLFLVIGVFDLLHLMNYPGMPFFITDSSVEKFAWFWLAARGTASLGLLYLISSTNKQKNANRIWTSTLTVVFLAIAIVTIYIFEKELPILITNQGPTILKNAFEYLFCIILIVSLVKTTRQYVQTRQVTDMELLVAIVLLLLSEITLTIYNEISDIYVVIGHLVKSFGYFYILKAFFLTSLHLTFYEKEKAENGLKHTQELLRSFYEHTADSITIMDTTGEVLAVNVGFERLYGWKAEEVKGKMLRDLMPELAENIDQTLAVATAGKDLIGYETIRQRKDGSQILVNMTLSPITNAKGAVIQLVAITRDVTSQREAERKLSNAEREFTETVRKQQGITFKVKKMNNSFVYTICDGQLLYELGKSPSEIVGKTIDEFLNDQTPDYVFKQYESAWQGSEVTYEVRYEGRILVVILKPILRDQKVVEIIGSCIDVTQLKKTEELLQKSEKLAVVGELAAGLAHEIRNPLTTLKGFTQLMNANSSVENKYFMELMLSELDRIESITNEFMAVAKPQSIQFQTLDLVRLVQQIVNFNEPQALMKGIELSEHYELTSALIYGDGNQIKQVFINIFKNAMEAMPIGGRISIMVQQERNDVVVRVKDTGIGIPKDILPRLGEPFYTLKEKGTGLGLMVSFRIIESHKGSISFESVEGEGTTVVITLPLLPID